MIELNNDNAMAVMHGFTILRNNERLHRLDEEGMSKARRNILAPARAALIIELLTPIAQEYEMEVKDLAFLIAKSMGNGPDLEHEAAERDNAILEVAP